MLSKFFGAAVLAGAILIPAIASAQTSTTGLINVYVQVINQYGTTYSPSNFNVAVSGSNPSPSSFAGSQSGTLVSVTPGGYSVTVTNQSNFTPSYSVGCSGTVAANQTQTCVITMSANSAYYPTPGSSYPYPYPYIPQPLTCRTDTPTVAMGQQARFTAVGGVGGTYNWYAGGQNFPNVGPVLTTSFTSSGSHTVSVTNAAQTATCIVSVTPSYYSQPTNPIVNPTYPNYQYPSYNYPTYNQPTLYATSYIKPRFPNTGVPPVSSEQMAFAVVLVMGMGIIAYPYARKAFAIAVR